jgi:hypothetical protein
MVKAWFAHGQLFVQDDRRPGRLLNLPSDTDTIAQVIRHELCIPLFVFLAFCSRAVAPCGAQDVAKLVNWHPGNVLAEVGANGQLTVAAAQQLGSTGRIYSTELDRDALAKLRELAANR